MHPELAKAFARFNERLLKDDRCVGLFLWGSTGTASEDDLSDLDSGVVIGDTSYSAFRAALRAVCEVDFGPIVGWLPEGETDGFINYAFLFLAGQHLLLAEVLTVSDTWAASNPVAAKDRIVFDKNGTLTRAAELVKNKDFNFTAEGLTDSIHSYWTYMYINGKYWQRGDLMKILSTQQSLFERHLALLRYRDPERRWLGWAAKDSHLLPADEQENLLLYFGRMRLDVAGDILECEMDLFSRDARRACDKWGVSYPNELEAHVREHLRTMIRG